MTFWWLNFWEDWEDKPPTTKPPLGVINHGFNALKLAQTKKHKPSVLVTQTKESISKFEHLKTNLCPKPISETSHKRKIDRSVANHLGTTSCLTMLWLIWTFPCCRSQNDWKSQCGGQCSTSTYNGLLELTKALAFSWCKGHGSNVLPTNCSYCKVTYSLWSQVNLSWKSIIIGTLRMRLFKQQSILPTTRQSFRPIQTHECTT